MKNCFVCKSDAIEAGFTAQTHFESGHLVVIKQIPCSVCSTCGETYLTTETMRALEAFLNKVDPAEVEIVSYEKIAA